MILLQGVFQRIDRLECISYLEARLKVALACMCYCVGTLPYFLMRNAIHVCAQKLTVASASVPIMPEVSTLIAKGDGGTARPNTAASVASAASGIVQSALELQDAFDARCAQFKYRIGVTRQTVQDLQDELLDIAKRRANIRAVRDMFCRIYRAEHELQVHGSL